MPICCQEIICTTQGSHVDEALKAEGRTDHFIREEVWSTDRQRSAMSARKVALTDVFRAQAQGTGEDQSVGMRREESWFLNFLLFFPLWLWKM